jgi:hypothetical protein
LTIFSTIGINKYMRHIPVKEIIRSLAGKLLRLCYFGIRLPDFRADVLPGKRSVRKTACEEPAGGLVKADSLEEIPAISLESGIYPGKSLTVSLHAPKGYTIAFTTDGKLPSSGDDSGLSEVEVLLARGGRGYLIENRDLMVYPEAPESFLLDDPSLPSGKVLRAALRSPSGEMGKPVTRVYFLTHEFFRLFPGCLTVSVVADPADLLEHEKGILAAGAVYDTWKKTPEAKELTEKGMTWEFQSNFTQHGRAWERPCLVQIYDGGNVPAAELNAGLRVTGHASRAENQKSFNIYFRKTYGVKYLDYELFEGMSRYKSFRLMNGGNNTRRLKFKDSFLKELVSDRHFAAASSRPAVLFLNGEYWGPYLLTEKVTARMLKDHFGVRKGQVILVKEGRLKEGKEEDMNLYRELMSFAEKDLADPCVWEAFCLLMDIRSMADYCAARIYFGDFDWYPDKNDLLWRTRDRSFNEGMWQYMLYDTGYSSGLYGNEETAPETDHFSLARQRYPLFAAALRNQEFYRMFLNSLREIGEENCSYERVKSLMADYEKVWKPLMPAYFRRFGDSGNLWMSSRRTTLRFFKKRCDLLIPLAEEYGKKENFIVCSDEE